MLTQISFGTWMLNSAVVLVLLVDLQLSSMALGYLRSTATAWSASQSSATSLWEATYWAYPSGHHPRQWPPPCWCSKLHGAGSCSGALLRSSLAPSNVHGYSWTKACALLKWNLAWVRSMPPTLEYEQQSEETAIFPYDEAYLSKVCETNAWLSSVLRWESFALSSSWCSTIKSTCLWCVIAGRSNRLQRRSQSCSPLSLDSCPFLKLPHLLWEDDEACKQIVSLDLIINSTIVTVYLPYHSLGSSGHDGHRSSECRDLYLSPDAVQMEGEIAGLSSFLWMSGACMINPCPDVVSSWLRVLTCTVSSIDLPPTIKFVFQERRNGIETRLHAHPLLEQMQARKHHLLLVIPILELVKKILE